MRVTCPSLGCGAHYDLEPAHRGKRFSCRKCGNTLLVGDDYSLRMVRAGAIQPESAPGSSPQEDSAMTTERANPLTKNLPWLQGNLGFVASFIFTVLFGFGTFLVLLFLFFPLIDQAKVARADAKINAGDVRVTRLRQEAEQEIIDRKLEGAQAEERRKKVEDKEKKWKTERLKLQSDLDELKASIKGYPYWYDWGMMFGFICLAFAGLGYLIFGQTTSMRVVGAVVIIGQVLLVFLRFLSPGAFTFHLPGLGG